MLESLRNRWRDFREDGFVLHKTIGSACISVGLDWEVSEALPEAQKKVAKVRNPLQLPKDARLEDYTAADVLRMEAAYPQIAEEGAGVSNETGVSNWRWPNQLTEAEQKVFDLDLDIWPRCIVALMAYAHFTGEGDLTDYPEQVYEEARKTHQYILGREHCSIEAFAEFAHVFCGLGEREAYAAFWKEEAWHLREGHRHFIRLAHDPRYDYVPF